MSMSVCACFGLQTCLFMRQDVKQGSMSLHNLFVFELLPQPDSRNEGRMNRLPPHSFQGSARSDHMIRFTALLWGNTDGKVS